MTDFIKDLETVIDSWETRMDWDDYFMSMALLISSRSSCERLHVGCVLVKDTHVISVGYNGFLAGLPHESKVVGGHEQATVHAEQNAIADCAKRGISTIGATAYITHYPCINCFKILISAGIAEIKYHKEYKNDPLVRELSTIPIEFI
jgi:dCMP deaminase